MGSSRERIRWRRRAAVPEHWAHGKPAGLAARVAGEGVTGSSGVKPAVEWAYPQCVAALVPAAKGVLTAAALSETGRSAKSSRTLPARATRLKWSSEANTRMESSLIAMGCRVRPPGRSGPAQPEDQSQEPAELNTGPTANKSQQSRATPTAREVLRRRSRRPAWRIPTLRARWRSEQNKR